MYNTIVPTWPPTPVLSGYLSHNSVVTLIKHCSILLIMKTVFSYDFMINAKGWENVFDLIDDFNFIDAGNKSDSTRNLKKKKLFRIIFGWFFVMFSNIWEMLFKLCLFCLFNLTQESKQKAFSTPLFLNDSYFDCNI